jgi:4-amino-4-deoxy-L-arabinose transferase-like glycosyltransferase
MVSRHESGDRRAQRPVAAGARGAPWILAGLTLLAAFLRFYRIGNQNLWLDEITTLNAVNMGARLSLEDLVTNIQGPLHAAVIWLVTQVTMREGALRAVSAVASVATVPIVFALGRELFDRRTGMLAALLFAVSPFSIWYAQEARNYAFLYAFAGLSTLLVYRLIERGGRVWAGYVLSTIAALYMNLSAAFLAVGHNLFAARRVLRDRRLLRRWAIAYAIIAVAFAPSLWGVARWAHKVEVAERVVFAPVAEEEVLLRGEHTFVAEAIPYSIFAMYYGYSLGPSLRVLHLDPSAGAFMRHAPLVIPAAVVLAAALVLGLVRAARSRAALAFIISMACAVFGGAVLASLLNIKPFTVRYASVIQPLLVVVVAAGIGALPRWPRVVLGAAVVILCGVSLKSHYYDPEHWKEDVRSVARYIEEHERPADVVLVPVVYDPFHYYFQGEAYFFTLHPPDTVSEERIERRIEEHAEQAPRLWFVDARLWGTDPARRIPAYLRGHHELLDHQAFPCAEVSLFRMLREEGSGRGTPAPGFRGEPVHSAAREGAQSSIGAVPAEPAAGGKGGGRASRCRGVAATVARVMLYTDRTAPSDAVVGEVRRGISEWRRTH